MFDRRPVKIRHLENTWKCPNKACSRKSKSRLGIFNCKHCGYRYGTPYIPPPKTSNTAEASTSREKSDTTENAEKPKNKKTTKSKKTTGNEKMAENEKTTEKVETTQNADTAEKVDDKGKGKQKAG